MQPIRVAAAQFEHHDADKAYNLNRIDELAGRAASEGAQIVSFHECCVTGYTFLQPFGYERLADLAEPVPGGESVHALVRIARSHDLIVMAGLLEVDDAGRLYNCYAVVGPGGYITKFRKLHPFINPHLSPGEQYHVTELCGALIGWLICYDNNLPENVRIAALMGAEVVFMPHVTGCTPSTMPGRGPVDPKLWERRDVEPQRLRAEFRGMKGRGWLMRWLPARAWENGVYAVFSNPIGMDGDTVKPGLAMILDPFGEVIAEANTFEDAIVTATLTPDNLEAASGRRYLRARRPELYGKLVEPPAHEPVTEPGWALRRER